MHRTGSHEIQILTLASFAPSCCLSKTYLGTRQFGRIRLLLIDYSPLPEQTQVTALMQQYTVPQRVQQQQQQHHEHATIPLPSGAQPREPPPQQSTEKGLSVSYPAHRTLLRFSFLWNL